MSEFNKQEQEYTTEIPVEPEETEATAEETEVVSDSAATAAVIDPERQRRLRYQGVVDYMEIFVFAICFVMLLFSFVFRLCRVDGDSMVDTLYEGESLIVSDLFYTPEQGDVIVFHQTHSLNEPVVKRVIATEGETVSLRYTYRSMTVTVTHTDGTVTELEEPYMTYEGYPLYLTPATYTVPEGHLFVLGDNRNNSKDSRSPDIGFVDCRRVLGQVLFRVTPLSRFGAID